MKQRTKLWDSIHAYVVACGGDPTGVSVQRQRAVVEVEAAVDAEIIAARREPVTLRSEEREELKAAHDLMVKGSRAIRAVLGLDEEERKLDERIARVLGTMGLRHAAWPDSGVYIVRDGERGKHCKIGYAANVPARLKELQTGCAKQLFVMAVVPGGAAEEAALHLRFTRLRARGEWFRVAPPIITFVRQARDDLEAAARR